MAGLIVWVSWKIVLAKNIQAKNLRDEDNAQSEKSRRAFSLGPLSVSLLAYAAAVAISGFGRPSLELGHLSGKEVLHNLTTLRPLIVYFWAFDIFKNMPRVRQPAILCMLSAAALGGIMAAIQQLFNWHPWGTLFLQGTGFLNEPMSFSGIMQIFSLLALALWITGGFRRFRKPFNQPLVFLLITIANIAGLVFASERSAWLGFVVAFVLSTSLLSLRLMFAACITLGAAVTFAWFFLPVVQIRLLPMFSGQGDAGMSVRFRIWHTAYLEFLRSPITGIGTTKFPHIEASDATQLGKSYLAHAHSNVMQVLSTAGILGLCSYIWIVLSVFGVSIKHLLRNTPHKTSQETVWANYKQRSERGIALGLFAAFVSLTISGLGEYNFGTGQVRLALWFALALLNSD